MNTATSQFDGHTPGPWMVRTHPGNRNTIVPADDRLYATLVDPDIAVVLNPNVCKDADLRLIAAAPELLRQRDALLAALRGIMPEAVGWGNSLSHDDYADAARKAAKVLESIENGALTVDLNHRLKEASDPTTSPERLAELAGDRKVGVRWWVARNPSTPAETLDRLTNDHNWTVELAAKTEALRRRTHPR